MLIFALSLAMVATLITATAVAIHNEAEGARIKARAQSRNIMR